VNPEPERKSNRRRFFIPVAWKIGFAILAVVALFGSINILLIQDRVTVALENEAERGADASVNTLVQQTVMPLLYRDNLAVQDLLDSVQQLDDRIAYAFVIDPDGRIGAHTFASGVPVELLEPELQNRRTPSGSVLIRSLSDPETLIRDMSLPIMHGRLGTLRMGLYEADIDRNVRKTVSVFGQMVALFLFLGLIGAFLFARYLTRPVRIIANAADSIRLATLGTRMHHSVRVRTFLTDRFPWAWRVEDEMDILTDHFNDMLSRLSATYADLERSHEHIIQSEKMASVGTLAAGIAHEINNPIAGLKNCLRRIEQFPENVSQNIRYLSMMNDAADKIELVVRGLLDFTRMQETQRDQVRCREIVEKALMLASYNLESARVSVTQEIAQDLPDILADSNQLEQVLLNLLINSIHAIEEKREQLEDFRGSITIRITRDSDGIILQIVDDGTGVRPNDLDRVFDPFFSTKDTGKGTGLGLAVCRRIIHAHGGSISVESTFGEGATVTVTLPREHESTVAPTGP
jgi:two-component system, NtrC family, sensor kinase